jgi:hypothetical protein
MSSVSAAVPASVSARWSRAGLVFVAAIQAEIGIWGLLAPHSFFTTFPGAGHHWVSELGTYNEHLVRDYAAAELGFTVLLLLTALWFTRTLVLAAGFAFLAATVPHLLYHLTTTDSLSTGDNLASLGGFVLEIAIVVAVMVGVARSPAAGSARSGISPPQG